jgi:RNA polymerase sigma factor (sigma-70 family)
LSANALDTDSIKSWLQGAGSVRLLAPDEVIAITRKIQALPEGSTARSRLVNKLVRHNLRLAVRFVKNFMRSTKLGWDGPDTLDYLQVAAMGLVKAADRFDPARGYTFSTYSLHWMRSYVSRYHIKNRTPVHVPEYAARAVQFYKRNGFLNRKSGRPVSDEEAMELTRQTELAVNWVSLDLPTGSDDSTGDMLLISQISDMIEGAPPAPDPNVTYDAMLQSLREAGLSEDGVRLIVGIFFENRTGAEMARELGISYQKAKKLKVESLDRARKNQKAFEPLTLVL